MASARTCRASASARAGALALVAVLATGCGLGETDATRPSVAAVPNAERARPSAKAGAAVPDRFATRPGSFAIARVRAGRSIALRGRPGGERVERLGSRTEFGSRRFLAVAAREGSWLGLVSAELPNGRLGWVDGRSRALTAYRTDISLHADLSRRQVELREGRHVVRRFDVGIGRAGYPTPTGRFAVTDKLSGRAYGGTYGCCILALSGHQVKLPPGWPGGDRLALHGTRDQGSIGNAASTGCLRGSDRNLRALLRGVPLGAPMFIRR